MKGRIEKELMHDLALPGRGAPLDLLNQASALLKVIKIADRTWILKAAAPEALLNPRKPPSLRLCPTVFYVQHQER
jgi:hypothetical protein